MFEYDPGPESSIFGRMIGLLTFYQALALGLMPDGLAGDFLENKIELLRQICKQHPRLHIVTMFDDRIYNRYVAGAEEYYLGDGESDPQLECAIEPITILHFVRMREDISRKPPEQRTGKDRFGLAWADAVLGGAGAFDAKVILEIACDDSTEKQEPVYDLNGKKGLDA